MTRETFALLEKYMLSCAGDAAHDSEHVRRVLYLALEIAETEEGVDRDLLIAACLLHDIGRPEQFADPALCHARVGGELARQRQAAARSIYENLLSEIREPYDAGGALLRRYIENT